MGTLVIGGEEDGAKLEFSFSSESYFNVGEAVACFHAVVASLVGCTVMLTKGTGEAVLVPTPVMSVGTLVIAGEEVGAELDFMSSSESLPSVGDTVACSSIVVAAPVGSAVALSTGIGDVGLVPPPDM